MSQYPKKHHYVPSFILRNFTDKDGFIYVTPNHGDAKKAHRSKPENAFYMYHYYSFDLPNGEKDFQLEKRYGENVESPSKHVIDRIIKESLNNKSVKLLKEEDVYILTRLVYEQFRRSPKMRDDIIGGDNIEEIIERIDTMLTKLNVPFTKEQKNDIRNDSKRTFLKELFVKAIMNEEGVFFRKLLECKISIIVADDERSSFVIGSNGVFDMMKDFNSMVDLNSILLFPVSSKILINLHVGKSGQTIFKNHDFVRKINLLTSQYSKDIAGCSKNLIESLRNPK